MKSQLGGLRRAFMENHLTTTTSRMSNKKTFEQKENNIIEWLTLF